MSRETELESKLTEGLEIINEWMKLCFEKSTEIQQLKKQLSEKEKEVKRHNEEWQKICDDKLETINRLIEEKHKLQQSQNQTAIENLERVKRDAKELHRQFCQSTEYRSNRHLVGRRFIEYYPLIAIIDQQITELKGGKQ